MKNNISEPVPDDGDEYEEDLCANFIGSIPPVKRGINVKARRELERRKEEQKLKNINSDWDYF